MSEARASLGTSISGVCKVLAKIGVLETGCLECSSLEIGELVTLSLMPEDVRQRFVGVVQRLGGDTNDYANILDSYQVTESAVSNARTHLARAELDSCVDVLGLGSMGRYEMSSESDLDYLIVCHADDEHDHAPDIDQVDSLRFVVIEGKELRPPGATGLFGASIRDEDLYAFIGLERDTNETHSRRALVLEESVSLHDPALHVELLRKMSVRYVDAIPLGRSRVPRFLLNDLARYWRQLAVDYQAKSETGQPSNLRRLKLIGPRKFTYASSVLPLLALELRELDKEDIVERVVEVFQVPPTLRFLDEVEYLGTVGATDLVEPALAALAAMDKFNGLLSDSEWRQRVQAAESRDEAEDLPEFRAGRDLARELQGHLDAVFFSPKLEQLTRKYLVF